MGRVFDGWLRDLGFASYAAYLNSGLWARIRSRVFDAKGRQCLRCGGKARQVHHRLYSPAVMRGDDIEPLEPICGDCHEREHGLHRVRIKVTTQKKPQPPRKRSKARKKHKPKRRNSGVAIRERCTVCGREHRGPGGPCRRCRETIARRQDDAKNYGNCSMCGRRRHHKSLIVEPLTKSLMCRPCRGALQAQKRREQICRALDIMQDRPNHQKSAMLMAYNERESPLGAALNGSRAHTRQPAATIKLRGAYRQKKSPEAKAQDNKPTSEIAAGRACGTVRQSQRPVAKANAK